MAMVEKRPRAEVVDTEDQIRLSPN